MFARINEERVGGMGDARVETLVHGICWDRLDLEKLRSTIVDALTDAVLTDDDDEADEDAREVWGDAAQMALLRSIYLAVSDVGLARVREADERAQRAQRGPHFFNLVLIMYGAWSERWREENLSDFSVSDDLDDSEDTSSDSDAGVTRAGVRGMQAGAEMRAVLQTLRGVCESMHV
jgi:hypothetical protein